MATKLFMAVMLSMSSCCCSQTTTQYTMQTPLLVVGEEDGTAQICILRTGDNIGASGFVVLSTIDETATGGEDFSALEEHQLVFEAFEKNKCLAIGITDDDNAEFKERFKVSIIRASDGIPGSQPFTEIIIEESDNCIQSSFTPTVQFYVSPWQPVSGKPIVFKNTIGTDDGAVFIALTPDTRGSQSDYYYLFHIADDRLSINVRNGIMGVLPTTIYVDIFQGNVDDTVEITFDQSSGTFVVSYSADPTNKIVYTDPHEPIIVKHVTVTVLELAPTGPFTSCINDIIPLPQVNAEQSSTSVEYPSAIALRSIDGDVRSQVEGSGTCSVTENTQHPWFRIDLDQEYEVYGINIFPVGDGDESGLDGDDIAGVEVFVGSCNETYLDQLHLCGKAPDVITESPLYIECTSTPYTYGKYVYIRHDTSADNVEKTLAFCEVKVYGARVPFGSETTVSFSSELYEVEENDAIVSINMDISGPGSSCATVDIHTTDDTAISTSTNPDQSDFTAIPQESPRAIRFDPDTSTQTVHLAINPDRLCEEEETFDVILSNAQACVLGIPSEAVVKISDDDTINYYIDKAENGFVIQEGDGPLQISIVRSAEENIEEASNVYFISERGGNEEITLVIFNAEETSKEVIIDDLDDNVFYGNTNFNVRLQTIGECDTLLDGADVATIMVKDDDSRFCFDDVVENAIFIPEDIGTYQVKVRREGTARHKTVGITVEHTDDDYGNAQQGNDFSVSENSLGFDIEEEEAYITLAIADDNFTEDSESFDLVLHDPNGIAENVKTPNTIKFIITDNDDVYRFHPQYYRVSEDERSINICLQRSGALSKTSTLKLETQDVSTTVNRDYAVPSGGLEVTFLSSMSEACTSINILGDSIIEETETFLVHIATREVDKEYNTQATVSIYDNMNAFITFDVDNYYVSEGDGKVTVYITKIGNIQQSVSASIMSSPLTADRNDYVSVDDVIRIPSGTSTISYEVTIKADDVNEANEQFKLTLSDTIGAVITLGTTTVNIVDSESASTLEPRNEISSGLLAGIIVAAVAITIITGLGVALFCAYFLRQSSKPAVITTSRISRGGRYGDQNAMRLIYG